MFTFTAAATGAYTLAVGGFPDSRNLTGEYTVDTRVMGEDEVPFTFEDAAPLDLGTSFGFIENSATDGDTSQIELTAGSLYRSEEHTSELQSLLRISYALSCSKKKMTPHHTLNHFTSLYSKLIPTRLLTI